MSRYFGFTSIDDGEELYFEVSSEHFANLENLDIDKIKDIVRADEIWEITKEEYDEITEEYED